MLEIRDFSIGVCFESACCPVLPDTSVPGSLVNGRRRCAC